MTVWETFLAHDGRQIDKWRHYFPIYEHHFARFVGKNPKVLEIGVDHGGSLQLWRKYFGSASLIIGVDIDQRCKVCEDDDIYVLIADQKDKEIAKWGPFDIVIDDGSHGTEDQEISFNNLWSKTNGVYLIEDCHWGYPNIRVDNGIIFKYPWVLVMERVQRLIKGNPSRELRPEEVTMREQFLFEPDRIFHHGV
jgi:hypothetical protein